MTALDSVCVDCGNPIAALQLIRPIVIDGVCVGWQHVAPCTATRRAEQQERKAS